jgi:L-alanine-DL-glutamate epimerase-like enolase superfamily enzyme
VKIVDVKVRVFNYKSRVSKDSAGHQHGGEPRDAAHAMLTITADDGSQGHCFHAAEAIRPFIVEQFLKKALIGSDPFHREKIWQDLYHRQRGSGQQFSDRALAVAELALWDLAGRKLDMPVHKLIGTYRTQIPAYGSIMCGDEVKGALSSPDDYANFALKLVARGYKAIKLHTWMPPVARAPDPKRDVAACAAVREAVGPGIDLMLDGYHWYSRSEILYIGRELERLHFAWIEEPMDEASIASYKWLADHIDVPVLGPESMPGKFRTRAEWAKAEAADMLRAGVFDVGGIGPSLKIAHLAESFGMTCEIHGAGVGNLIVAATVPNCTWFERGLLHPTIDYDEAPAYLHQIHDPMDKDGFVHISDRPGLGEDINFDYIDNNLIT